MAKELFRKGWLMLIIPLLGLIYGPLNNDNGHVHNLVTSLDRAIVFNRYFIIPYMAWYGIIFGALIWFLFTDSEIYYSAISAISLGLIVCFMIFAVFQTTVPRPVIAGNDIFSRLVKFMYATDNPYNAFPSIHVMTSSIILAASQKTKAKKPIISWVLQLTGVSIILATLFLKQHTIADALAGIALGIGMLKVSEKRLVPYFAKVWRQRPITYIAQKIVFVWPKFGFKAGGNSQA